MSKKTAYLELNRNTLRELDARVYCAVIGEDEHRPGGTLPGVPRPGEKAFNCSNAVLVDSQSQDREGRGGCCDLLKPATALPGVDLAEGERYEWRWGSRIDVGGEPKRLGTSPQERALRLTADRIQELLGQGM